ncbi:MAG: hypothetical protein ACREB3_03710, partial [Burkholderiales bacterium]
MRGTGTAASEQESGRTPESEIAFIYDHLRLSWTKQRIDRAARVYRGTCRVITPRLEHWDIIQTGATQAKTFLQIDRTV